MGQIIQMVYLNDGLVESPVNFLQSLQSSIFENLYSLHASLNNHVEHNDLKNGYAEKIQLMAGLFDLAAMIEPKSTYTQDRHRYSAEWAREVLAITHFSPEAIVNAGFKKLGGFAGTSPAAKELAAKRAEIKVQQTMAAIKSGDQAALQKLSTSAPAQAARLEAANTLYGALAEAGKKDAAVQTIIESAVLTLFHGENPEHAERAMQLINQIGKLNISDAAKKQAMQILNDFSCGQCDVRRAIDIAGKLGKIGVQEAVRQPAMQGEIGEAAGTFKTLNRLEINSNHIQPSEIAEWENAGSTIEKALKPKAAPLEVQKNLNTIKDRVDWQVARDQAATRSEVKTAAPVSTMPKTNTSNNVNKAVPLAPSQKPAALPSTSTLNPMATVSLEWLNAQIEKAAESDRATAVMIQQALKLTLAGITNGTVKNVKANALTTILEMTPELPADLRALLKAALTQAVALAEVTVALEKTEVVDASKV